MAAQVYSDTDDSGDSDSDAESDDFTNSDRNSLATRDMARQQNDNFYQHMDQGTIYGRNYFGNRDRELLLVNKTTIPRIIRNQTELTK